MKTFKEILKTLFSQSTNNNAVKIFCYDEDDPRDPRIYYITEGIIHPFNKASTETLSLSLNAMSKEKPHELGDLILRHGSAFFEFEELLASGWDVISLGDMLKEIQDAWEKNRESPDIKKKTN